VTSRFRCSKSSCRALILAPWRRLGADVNALGQFYPVGMPAVTVDTGIGVLGSKLLPQSRRDLVAYTVRALVLAGCRQ